jgi:hypothetical protein
LLTIPPYFWLSSVGEADRLACSTGQVQFKRLPPVSHACWPVAEQADIHELMPLIPHRCPACFDFHCSGAIIGTQPGVRCSWHSFRRLCLKLASWVSSWHCCSPGLPDFRIALNFARRRCRIVLATSDAGMRLSATDTRATIRYHLQVVVFLRTSVLSNPLWQTLQDSTLEPLHPLVVCQSGDFDLSCVHQSNRTEGCGSFYRHCVCRIWVCTWPLVALVHSFTRWLVAGRRMYRPVPTLSETIKLP